ncbi:hypothetical protein POX_h09666 [Penicillium oxalicum]|uniref:hypothetical protein n=1 Tax=Penicillium oxalicum TaxID=69781 RepID=UPI0020B87BBF|nr:hypothetical protein POX_h09666 [Penicillium oxalicum]KAI2785904.1 hypothetical protein POX_h09666 [Penicillium oxalicum]
MSMRCDYLRRIMDHSSSTTLYLKSGKGSNDSPFSPIINMIVMIATLKGVIIRLSGHAEGLLSYRGPRQFSAIVQKNVCYALDAFADSENIQPCQEKLCALFSYNFQYTLLASTTDKAEGHCKCDRLAVSAWMPVAVLAQSS